MKFSKKILLLSIVFIISIMISINLNTQQVTSYRGINPIIIFDVAHQQTFNHTQMQSAIQLIEQEFDAEVYINYDNFTYTNLFGADLVIIPAPFIYAIDVGTNSPFTTIEDRAIIEYYQDGGSVLFLANPYFFEDNMENYSSNLRDLNLFMGQLGHQTEDYSSLALADQNGILLNDYSYRYNDPRFIYIDNTTMDTEHPIIIGGNAEKTVNELLTCSYFSPKDYADRIINTSLTTYDLDSTGKVLSGGNYRTILLADEKFEGRGISCASMLMFSDLKIVENDTITWFKAYDNALLWENMIAWLLKDIPEPERIYPITEFGFFASGMIAIFFILVVFGSILFTIGREAKKIEVSEALTKMRERDDRKKKDEEEIEKAFLGEGIEKEEAEKEAEEEIKELDMKTISEEIKKKPTKMRSRSERRRGR